MVFFHVPGKQLLRQSQHLNFTSKFNLSTFATITVVRHPQKQELGYKNKPEKNRNLTYFFPILIEDLNLFADKVGDFSSNPSQFPVFNPNLQPLSQSHLLPSDTPKFTSTQNPHQLHN